MQLHWQWTSSDGVATSSSSSTTPSTTAATLPDQNPAELAACVADSQSLQTALAAYPLAEHGSYPSPPAPWTAATYAGNYSPLTAASDGGPFLRNAPGTKFYVIEYDAAGHVWVAPPGVYGGYNKGQDFAAEPDICDAAVGCPPSTTRSSAA